MTDEYWKLRNGMAMLYYLMYSECSAKDSIRIADDFVAAVRTYGAELEKQDAEAKLEPVTPEKDFAVELAAAEKRGDKAGYLRGLTAAKDAISQWGFAAAEIVVTQLISAAQQGVEDK